MGYNPNFSGTASKAPSRAIQTGYTNGTVSLIPKQTVVYTNVSGQILPLDISSEANVSSMVGVTNIDVPGSANGTVVSSGRLENISLAFSIGDAVYAAPGSTLINQKPNAGSNGFVPGMFVIFIGVVVQNEFNPLQKDILLMPQLIGQL